MESGADPCPGYRLGQTAGNDTIVGFGSGDTYAGGLGDDVINGGDGNDTYVYARGDGNDTITESEWSGTSDKLILTDINPADVTVSFAGSDLLISIAESAPGAGDAGSILIKATLGTATEQGVETIVFADGTTWNQEQIRAQAIASVQTAGNDTIVGFGSGDTYAGGLGDDVINGGGGNDAYVYARGDGNDTITESEWSGTSDKLILTDINPADVTVSFAGSDLLISIAESAPGAGDAGSILIKATLGTATEQGVETIVFADGTTWNKEQIRAQAIASVQTVGNDTIFGFGSGDTYAGGLGDDVINGRGGNDTYVYARGDGNDTIIDGDWSGTADQLTFTNINPADITLVRDGDDIRVLIRQSIPGANDNGSIVIKNTIEGYSERGIEKFVFSDGTIWDRTIILAALTDPPIAQPTPTITGTSGDDVLVGTAGNDVFEGDTGDDQLNGGAGSDIYIYASGDGKDNINDDSGITTDKDTLLLVDMNPDDITLTRVGLSSILTVKNSGQTITLNDQFYSSSGRGLEQIEFANGTVWDRATIAANSWIRGTFGNDQLGTDSNPYRISNVTVDLGLGDDSVNADWATGYTVIYRSGDGNDIYRIWNNTQSTSVLKLLDLNVEDLTFSREGQHLKITDVTTGQTITTRYFFDSNQHAFARIDFADGTQWGRTQILEQAAWIRGTSGNDQLGTDSNPYRLSNVTVDLGLGDDSVNADWATGYTVIYRSGDGNDTYRIWNNTQSTSVLKLLDLNVEDLTFSREGQHLKIADVTTGQTITTRFFFDSNQHAFARIDFADGTQWGRTQILEKIASIGAMSENDIVVASNSAGEIDGSRDDIITDDDRDAFVFAEGFGQDLITDFVAAAGTDDVLQFDDSLFATFESVLAAAAQSGNDTVISFDTANTITLQNVLKTDLHQDDVRFVA
ncbi:hypothetical protein MRBLMR1_002086 [Neorhizobium sp. LMR1-1-1.1]